MHKKHIYLSIFCNKFPFEIKIYTSNGMLVVQRVVASNNSIINFCTSSNRLIIVAKFNNSTQRKVLCLSNCCFQNYIVNFDFWNEVIIYNPAVQNFLLYDKNYNLPITAILSFQEK